MPGVRAGLAQLILLTIFGVVFHDAAGQLVDDGLPRRGILAAGQFCDRFCQRRDDLVGIDDVWPVRRHRIFGKESIDHFDDQTMQARSLFVVALLIRHLLIWHFIINHGRYSVAFGYLTTIARRRYGCPGLSSSAASLA